jgi:hypothetical protein
MRLLERRLWWGKGEVRLQPYPLQYKGTGGKTNRKSFAEKGRRQTKGGAERESGVWGPEKKKFDTQNKWPKMATKYTIPLLRAKSRITAGSSHAALQGLVFHRFSVKGVHLTFFPSYSADLQAILLIDPDHCEARDLLSHFDGEAQTEAGNVSLDWLRGMSAVT